MRVFFGAADIRRVSATRPLLRNPRRLPWLTPPQMIQVVRPHGHHGASMRHELGPVISRPQWPALAVRELGFDHVGVHVELLGRDGACHRAEAMRRHLVIFAAGIVHRPPSMSSSAHSICRMLPGR